LRAGRGKAGVKNLAGRSGPRRTRTAKVVKEGVGRGDEKNKKGEKPAKTKKERKPLGRGGREVTPLEKPKGVWETACQSGFTKTGPRKTPFSKKKQKLKSQLETETPN